jgi:putative membrane protein
MIKRYSDHAANERTFLAWVRTAIAVIAFGFPARRSVRQRGRTCLHRARRRIIMIAGWRFVRTAKDIDSEAEVASPGEPFDVALAGIIGLLGAALFLYLSHAVFPVL